MWSSPWKVVAAKNGTATIASRTAPAATAVLRAVTGAARTSPPARQRAAHRPRPGHLTPHDLDAKWLPGRRIVSDHQHALERAAHRCELSLRDRPPADVQERLGDAAQPPRRPAGDDRARDFHSLYPTSPG